MDDVVHDGLLFLAQQNSPLVSTFRPPAPGGETLPQFVLRAGWMLKLGDKVAGQTRSEIPMR